MIPVTKPFLPPIEEYYELLNGVWGRNWLTNDGPLVKELEKKLISYMNLDHLLYVSNGTIALQFALKALKITGEVITTPFSYVATTSSIVWEGCTPVFVDINKASFNIDPAKIEAAITPKTQAILATHVFGNPCEVESIKIIADKYGLKVIYDAAHCFGTKYKGSSILEWGDISTISFHATKLFHSVEGGAVITKDTDLMNRMSYYRNFGHDGPGKFNGVGINGKNSEIHAAMGICNLRYIDRILASRKKQSMIYDALLNNLDIEYQNINDKAEYNFAYYPIVFQTEKQTLKSKIELEKNNIFPRRYFTPSLSKLSYINSVNMPVSESISRRILCLPLYFDITDNDQKKVGQLLIKDYKN